MSGQVTSLIRKPEKCPICSKLVAVKNKGVHINFHFGINETFACCYCVKVFSSKQELQAHKQSHNKDQPLVYKHVDSHEAPLSSQTNSMVSSKQLLQCRYCPKAFAFPCYLRSHYKQHSNERPYRCPYPLCLKTYKRTHEIWKHLELTGHSNHSNLTRNPVAENEMHFFDNSKISLKPKSNHKRSNTSLAGNAKESQRETDYPTLQSIKDSPWPKVVLSRCLTEVLAKCIATNG